MTPIPTSLTAPCFVDVLPDELLAYIFRLGEEEIEDDIIEDRKFVNSKDAKSNDAHDSSESTDKGKQVDVVDVSDGDEEDEEWSGKLKTGGGLWWNLCKYVIQGAGTTISRVRLRRRGAATASAAASSFVRSGDGSEV